MTTPTEASLVTLVSQQQDKKTWQASENEMADGRFKFVAKVVNPLAEHFTLKPMLMCGLA